MTALIRYQLALTVHAQRYLGPVLLHLIVLSVFTINDIGPLTGTYVVVAGSLLIATCWLTVVILHQEEPPRRAATVVTAGGPGRVLAAETALAVLSGTALLAVGTIFPILSGDHVVTPAAVTAGVLAQLTALTTGAAAGLLCSRLVVPRPGWSLLLAVVAVGVLTVTPGLPPINPMLRLLGGPGQPADLLVPLLGRLAIASALLALATALTHVISRRRT